MWTPTNRGRMADIAKKTKRYPSDLTDEEWQQIAPLLPKPSPLARHTVKSVRSMARRMKKARPAAIARLFVLPLNAMM